MGKYSDESDIEQAVLDCEDAYVTAQDALRASPDDAAVVAAYREAADNYFMARQAARAGRGMAIITTE